MDGGTEDLVCYYLIWSLHFGQFHANPHLSFQLSGFGQVS